MKKIEIYDPAMCCPTGVCGPSVDPELTRVAAAVFSLEKKGYQIQRYQLTSDPEKFAENEVITQLFEEEGSDVLPVTIVDGQAKKIGNYPTNEEFAEWFGVKAEELNEKPKVKTPIQFIKK